MAQNDALTFYVKFMEDSSQSIDALIRQLTQKMQNVNIKLNSQNVDVSGLESAMGKLKGVKVVDQTNLKEAEAAIKNIESLLSKAFTGKSGGEQFTGVLRALTQIREEIGNVSAEMGKMSTAISNLGSGMSANIGSAIVNNMTRINEAIDKSIGKLAELNKAIEEPGKTGTPKAVNDAVNFDMAKTKISEINEQLKGLWQTMKASYKLDFDTGSLEKYISGLEKVRATLLGVVAAGGDGKRVDEILRESNFRSLSKDAANEKRAVDEVSQAVERLKESLRSLDGMSGAGDLRKRISDQISKLERDYKNPGAGRDGKGNLIEVPVGVKLQQAENANRYNKALVDEAKQFVKDYNREQTQAAKESERAQREQQKETQKTAEAQQKVKKAIQESSSALDKLRVGYNQIRQLAQSFPNAGIKMNGILSQMSALGKYRSQMERVLRMGATDPQKLMSFAGSDKMTAWVKNLKAGLAEVDAAVKKAVSSESLVHTLDAVKAKLEAIKALGAQADNLGFKGLSDDAKRAYDDLKKIEEELKRIQQTGKSSKGLGLADYMKTGNVQAALSRAGLSEKAISGGIDNALRKRRERNEQEITRLKNVLRELQQMRNVNPQVKVAGVENAIQEVQRLIAELNRAKESGLSRQTVNLGRFGVNETAGTMAQVRNEHATSLQAAAAASQQVEAAQQRMAQAINQATGSAQQQSQVLSDLRSMAAQYLSVWGASNFVKEVAQITGELELQERSLSAIIGSSSKAHELFGEIKGLSQMSPYTFQDMLKSTKQLAAFGVETKDLYGTMKSLSDLGAGLDVDVQRLILAYGHVKSAGVLSGIQRRQFETAGINITGEIAKLYNERYRQAGSSEHVSQGDVFNMIKNREVMFKDVEQAISRLTSPGGRFFDMQLKQYDTLGGKLRNLKNNYNIMLDEIGKSYMDFLTMGVDGLNSLMENWRKWKGLIVDVVAALAAAKAASLALGKSWTAISAARNAARKMRYEEQALGTPLTPKQRAAMSTNYVQGIVNNNELNKFQKLRAVLRSSVSGDDRWLAVNQITNNARYADQIKNMNRWQLGFERLKLSAKSFFATMRAGFVSIATNPLVWIGAAIAGITALTQKSAEIRENSDRIIKSAKESAEDIKNIREITLPIRDDITNKKTGEIDLSNTDQKVISDIMKSLDDAMQKFDPLYKGHLVDVKLMEDDVKKVEGMMDHLEDVSQGKELAERMAPAIARANTESGYGDRANWNNLGLRGNWGQWNDATTEMKEYEQEWTDLTGKMQLANDVLGEFLMSQDALKDSSTKELAEYFQKAKAATPNKENYEILSEYAMKGKKIDFTEPSLLAQAVHGSRNPAQEALERWAKANKKENKIDVAELIGTSGFDSKSQAIKEKTKGIADAIRMGINNGLRKGNSKGSIAVGVKEMINNLTKEIGDDATRKKIESAILNQLVPPKNATQEVKRQYKEVFEEIENASAGEEMNDLLARMVRAGEINVNTPIEQIKEKVRVAWDAIKQEHLNNAQGPWFKQITETAFENMFAGAMVNPVPLLQNIEGAWYGIEEYLQDESFVAICNVDIDGTVSSQDLWEKLDKQYNEDLEAIQQLGTTWDIFHNINFKFNGFMDASSLIGIRDAVKGVGDQLGPLDPTNQAVYDDMVKRLNRAIAIANKARSVGHRVAPKSGGGGGGGGHRGHSGGSGSKGKSAEDKAKEAADEAKDLFSEMTQWIRLMRTDYKDLTERYNPMEAWKKAVEDYRRQFPKGDGPLDKLLDGKKLEDAQDDFVNGFVGLLDMIRQKIDASDAFKNKNLKDKDREKILSDLTQGLAKERQELEQIKLDELSEKASADLDNTMESVMRDFENAKKIFEATGDIQSIADLFSSIGSGNVSSSLDEVLAEYLGRDLALTLSNVIGNGDLEKIISGIDFVGVAKMSDGAIAEYVKNMVGKKDMAQYSDTLINWLKRFRDEYNNTQAKAFDVYAEVLGKRQDYTSLPMKIEGDVNRQLEYLRRTGAPQDMIDRLEAILRDNAALDKLKLDPEYARFMGSDVTMSKEQMASMFNRIFSADLKLFSDGGMTGEEMQNQSKDLLDKMRAYTEAQIDATLDITRMGYLTRQYNEAMTKYLDAIRDAYMASESVRDAEAAYKKAVEAEAAAREHYSDDPEINEMLRMYYRQVDLIEESKTATSERKAEIDAEMGQIRTLLAKYSQEDIDNFVSAYRESMNKAAEDRKLAGENLERAKSGQDSAGADAEKAWEFLLEIFKKMMDQTKLEKAFDKAVEYLGNFQGALDLVTETLDALGLEGMSNVTTGASELLGGILSGSSALSFAGPWGMAAGAALGLIGGIAQLHDNNLQRKIDQIRQDTEKMSNTLETIRALRERTLGYDEGNLRRLLADQYNMQGAGIGQKGSYGAIAAMAEYYGRYALGNGYEQELGLLEEQRLKLIEMYNLENSKKKKNKEELEDYRSQIAELDEQIMFFVQDLANELWGIDLKGWADQLGDALMTAFENGTSAASAFKDTVQDIMRGVVKNMLTVGIIEPALQKLQEKLFGKNGQGGIFDSDNVAGTMGATLNALGEWFNNEGPAIMNAANEFFNGADNMMRQTLGYGMMENERSTSTADSITSTASEETMGIVAGYLARVSQDVSVQRIIQEMFVNGSWPDYVEQVTTANNSLAAIDRSTTAMMEMMRDGNGALYERVENMSRRLDNFANGVDTITMR